jgi:hypothetical protein
VSNADADAAYWALLREEMEFAAAFLRSRSNAGANLAATIQAMASVIGQTAAQIPSPFSVPDRLELICDEIRKSAAVYVTMTPAQRKRAEIGQLNG